MLIRNIAIIAHVDHGKTTLVDQMLRQSGVFRDNENVRERVLDSNPLERERGITILSKNAAVHWSGVKINIVDTPGHADFGGEVERILRMVDAVLLLVDAVEGPMPQTRFVTTKALELDLPLIVVVNKADRPDSRAREVHDEVLELFMDLEAVDAQLDSPFLYASGREGWATLDPDDPSTDLTPLFETIIEHVPPPRADTDGGFQMLVSTLDHSPYVGRIAIGRIERGRVRVGQPVVLLPPGEPGTAEEDGSHESVVMRLYTFEGLARVEADQVSAGDIIAVAGLDEVEIGATVTDPGSRERLRGIAVEEPTLSVDYSVNDAPFAGLSGKYVTTRQLRERLYREVERNVALRVEDTDEPDTFAVSGRGELHLTVLMEEMRREGYEFQVSRPRVITKKGEAGETLEPIEDAVMEVPSAMVGVVIEKMGARKAELRELRPMNAATTRLAFRLPARGLFGYRSEFLTDTRGEGVLHHNFGGYGPWAGTLAGRRRGVLVADREGQAVAYAIFGLQRRATLFVSPGDRVYCGMIVGEHVRRDDVDVNVTREKKLTNIRAAASDENIRLEPPRRVTLELALEFVDEDELIEVTPDSIRLRKRILDSSRRRKASRRTVSVS